MTAHRTDGPYSSQREDAARREVVRKITARRDAYALAIYFRDEHDAYITHNGTTGKHLSVEERQMVDAVVAEVRS